MKQKLLLAVLFLGACAPPAPKAPRAVTTWPTDGSVADVQAKHDQAANGDTITVPAGTFTWTTGVTFTKAVILQGAGMSATIIKDAKTDGNPIILWTLPANAVSQITGIGFQNGGRATFASACGGWMRIVGNNTNGSQFRMHHCQIGVDGAAMNGSFVLTSVIGVVDHCTIYSNGNDDTLGICGTNWNGDMSAGYGDASWHDPNNFGSQYFTFFEDNVFHNSNTTYAGVFTDSYAGGRFVVRYCQIYNTNIGTHGTDSSGRLRGVKAVEVYNNTFTGTNISGSLGNSRSGQLVYHDNTATGRNTGFGPPQIALNNIRAVYPNTQFGGGDGTSPWDDNSPTVYYSGTTAGANSGFVITVNGSPNWTTNQWKGYTIRRLSPGTTPSYGFIKSNTSNTITYFDGVFANLAFANGDSFEIRFVNHFLDQPGWVDGSYINGNPPIRPAGWNDQVVGKCYQWNNTSPQGNAVFQPNWGVRPENFVNDQVMPGYTPYVYPHPLVSGGGPAPTTTPNASPTPTPSSTSTSTPTPSPSVTATRTPTATATPTGTATSTPMVSPTATAVATGTAIATSTPTASATNTPTPTITPTATVTPSATVTPAPTPPVSPQVPTGLTTKVVRGKDVQLDWQYQGSVDKFELARADNCDNWTVAVAKQLPSIANTFTDTSTVKKQHYCYRVRACIGDQCSSWSNTAEITP